MDWLKGNSTGKGFLRKKNPRGFPADFPGVSKCRISRISGTSPNRWLLVDCLWVESRKSCVADPITPRTLAEDARLRAAGEGRELTRFCRGFGTVSVIVEAREWGGLLTEADQVSYSSAISTCGKAFLGWQPQSGEGS